MLVGVGLGVAVVMATLTILMLAIMVMTRLAPGKKGHAETEMAKTTEEDEPTKESVAAIADKRQRQPGYRR